MNTALALLGLLAVSNAAPAHDKVNALPDCGPPPTPMYSGYLNVSQTKALHYIFVGSASPQAATDPVVIWLNGGPGCSSLLGAFSENGPFVFDDGQNVIKPNLYSWHSKSNLLYIESPANIGFSIGGINDWNYTDMSQSVDLFKAVQSFYVLFPELLPNALWITGESYAGVYGPYLAWQIHLWNQQAGITNTTSYNLTGFAIGNGITDWTVDAEPATWQTFTEFSTVPYSLLKQFTDNKCEYNVAKPFANPAACAPLESQVNNLIAGLNPYDMFRTTYGLGSSSTQKSFFRKLQANEPLGESVVGGEVKTFQRGVRLEQYTPWVKKNKLLAKAAAEISFGDPMGDYLNRADVRAALNIPLAVQGWSGCTNNPLFNYPFSYEASIWIYRILIRYGYQMMHYSGDTDGVVPTLGTRRWIDSLNWKITSPWQPWTTDGQVSGYTQSYGTFEFVTIHGVGHMAPQWKRKDMHAMIMAYIHGQSYLAN